MCLCLHLFVYVGKMEHMWAYTGLHDATYSFIDPDFQVNLEDYFQNVDITEKVSFKDWRAKTSLYLNMTPVI